MIFPSSLGPRERSKNQKMQIHELKMSWGLPRAEEYFILMGMSAHAPHAVLYASCIMIGLIWLIEGMRAEPHLHHGVDKRPERDALPNRSLPLVLICQTSV